MDLPLPLIFHSPRYVRISCNSPRERDRYSDPVGYLNRQKNDKDYWDTKEIFWYKENLMFQNESFDTTGNYIFWYKMNLLVQRESFGTKGILWYKKNLLVQREPFCTKGTFWYCTKGIFGSKVIFWYKIGITTWYNR